MTEARSEADERALKKSLIVPVWGASNIGRLINRSRREVKRLYDEVGPDGRKHPLGELMWMDASGKLCIDPKDVQEYFARCKEGDCRQAASSAQGARTTPDAGLAASTDTRKSGSRKRRSTSSHRKARAT